MQNRTLVIGVGNRCRGDDAAGPRVTDQLPDIVRSKCDVIEHWGEGADLMECWQSRPSVIAVDAVSSGHKPGHVFRLEAHRDKIPARFFHYSTHAFSLAEAVELARSLGTLPRRLVIYGIEGAFFGFGEKLSPPVATAVAQVAARILEDVSSLADSRRNTDVRVHTSGSARGEGAI